MHGLSVSRDINVFAHLITLIKYSFTSTLVEVYQIYLQRLYISEGDLKTISRLYLGKRLIDLKLWKALLESPFFTDSINVRSVLV